MNSFKLEISWASLWRILVMVVFVVLLYVLKDVAITLLLSLFISTSLNGMVLRLEKFRVPRILAAIIIFAVVIFVLAFIVYTVVPIAIIELNSLLNNLDGTVGGILGPETVIKIKEFINPDLNHLADILLAGNASFLDIIGKLLGGVAYFFTVLITSFYLTVSRDGVVSLIRSIFPSSTEETAIQIYERTRRKISKWFHAQLILSVVVGFVVFTGLALMGVRYSLILGILAGAFELIPVVGPIFAGTLSVIIALTTSSTLGLYVFILFIVVQQLESNVLVPLMLKKAIDIHPVIVIIALLAGVQLAGIAGMVLAIPFTVLAEECLSVWTAKKIRMSTEVVS